MKVKNKINAPMKKSKNSRPYLRIRCLKPRWYHNIAKFFHLIFVRLVRIVGGRLRWFIRLPFLKIWNEWLMDRANLPFDSLGQMSTTGSISDECFPTG